MELKSPKKEPGSPRVKLPQRPQIDPVRFAPSTIKSAARDVMSSDWKNTLTVTGVFLLLTLWARTLFLLFCPNPVMDAMDSMNNALYALSSSAETLTLAEFSAHSSAIMTEAFSVLREGLGTTWGLTSTFVLILLLLVGLVADYGMMLWSLRRVRGEEANLSVYAACLDLAGRIILLTVLVAATVCIWFWLLLFPALYFWYRFRMAGYLLLDYPELSAMQAYGLSGSAIYGLKWKLFQLDVSFLGWVLLAEFVGELPALVTDHVVVMNLLSLVAVSAVYLYTQPYRSLAYAKFYDELKQTAPAIPMIEDMLRQQKQRMDQE